MGEVPKRPSGLYELIRQPHQAAHQIKRRVSGMLARLFSALDISVKKESFH